MRVSASNAAKAATPESDSAAIREFVRRAVGACGVAPVARVLGVSTHGVLTYLAGTARAGTNVLVETRSRERVAQLEAMTSAAAKVQP